MPQFWTQQFKCCIFQPVYKNHKFEHVSIAKVANVVLLLPKIAMLAESEVKDNRGCLKDQSIFLTHLYT